MGLGIREPATDGSRHVPGTASLFDDGTTEMLEHKKGSDLVLHPQPSSSPNDPLNWPLWKKDLTLFSICFGSGITCLLGPLLAPVNGVLAEEYKVSYNAVAELSGYMLFTSAITAVLSSVVARIFGKRPVYLFGAFIALGSTLWIIYNSSFDSFLAARSLYGLSLGIFGPMPSASIGDLYFVHQRGARLTISVLFALGCVNIAPILGGYIAETHGWRMQYKIVAPFQGLSILLIIFFGPETTYRRPMAYNTDVISAGDLAGQIQNAKVETQQTQSGVGDSSPEEPSEREQRRTWVQELSPFSGRHYSDNVFKLLARPLVCLLYPAVWVGFLLIGVFTAWDVGTAVVMAQIFAPPPALFGPAKLGYAFAFAAVGSITSTIFGVYLMDNTTKWAARRNKRVFEPEFRLILTIPAFVIGIPGLFGFGYYATSTSPSWVVVSVLFGLITFADMLMGTIAASYVLDCHRDYAVEMSVALTVLRNCFSFGATHFLPIWLQTKGVKNAFYAIGGLELGIFGFCFFVYHFGKCQREWIHKHSPLKTLRLE